MAGMRRCQMQARSQEDSALYIIVSCRKRAGSMYRAWATAAAAQQLRKVLQLRCWRFRSCRSPCACASTQGSWGRCKLPLGVQHSVRRSLWRCS